MSPAILPVIILIITVLIVAQSFRSLRKRRSSGLPPGDMGWPIIGQSISFLKPHASYKLGSFMEHNISRFGKIFTTSLFGNLAVVSADAELNHLILQNDTKLFGHGWPQHVVKMIGETATPVAQGDAHRFQRSIFLNFFCSRRLESWILPDAEQIATILISSWENNSVIRAKDESMKFTFNIMAKKTLSMAPGVPETEKLRTEFETFLAGLFSLPLRLPGSAYWKALRVGTEYEYSDSQFLLLPIIYSKDVSLSHETQAGSNLIIHTKTRKASKTIISNTIKKKMEERVQKKGVSNAELEDDLLGWLLDSSSYSWEQIIDLLRNLIASAYLTTSRVIPIVIYFLGRCPRALEQLREEHLRSIRSKSKGGDGKLTWEDYKHLKFTQCVVINETLRLGSGSILPKKACIDIQYKGYVIPRGCTVMANISAVHLDPSLYEDPESFNPWRWLDASGKAKLKHFMPFGGGMRQCPGAELAKLEIIVFIRHLILNYNWELISPDCPITAPHVDFLKGLPVKVQALLLE
ncbi:cytochrome P450 90B2-like [Phoenix dactylifera]|uniref:Cytochrome P450 90B2-like n=1 Tax=Phoenix dactylifera TaxID=42345 RepID=A0A8B9AGU1_PHODC|nr:cytochrome P450 90B2-like [Phoenix dactylifera]